MKWRITVFTPPSRVRRSWGGAAAAVSALTAKAKLAGMWREKVDQHNTGTGTVSTVWSVSWDEEVEQSDGREAG
jgi:hypothetical protein